LIIIVVYYVLWRLISQWRQCSSTIGSALPTYTTNHNLINPADSRNLQQITASTLFVRQQVARSASSAHPDRNQVCCDWPAAVEQAPSHYAVATGLKQVKEYKETCLVTFQPLPTISHAPLTCSRLHIPSLLESNTLPRTSKPTKQQPKHNTTHHQHRQPWSAADVTTASACARGRPLALAESSLRSNAVCPSSPFTHRRT